MRRLLVLLGCSLLIGCASDPCAQEFPLCDVRDDECQRAVHEAVRCMRGAASTEVPPIRVISPDELATRSGEPMMDAPPTHWDRGLQLLGLVPESVRASVSRPSIDGLYSPIDREIVIVDRGQPLDGEDALITLAHELVHAAQDEESDLETLLREARTSEAQMRVRSAIEGEATFYSFRAALWQNDLDPEQFDWQGWLREYHDRVDAAAMTAPSSFLARRSAAPYVFGSRRAAARYLDGGDDAVRRMVAEVPRTSADVLADPFAIAFVARPLEEEPCPPIPPPDGFFEEGRDQAGALLFYLALLEWRVPVYEARSIALGWQGDELVVFGSAPDSSAAAWRIHLAPSTVVSLALTRLRSTRERIFGASGSTLVVLAADPRVLPAWRWPRGDNEACGSPQ